MTSLVLVKSVITTARRYQLVDVVIYINCYSIMILTFKYAKKKEEKFYI